MTSWGEKKTIMMMKIIITTDSCYCYRDCCCATTTGCTTSYGGFYCNTSAGDGCSDDCSDDYGLTCHSAGCRLQLHDRLHHRSASGIAGDDDEGVEGDDCATMRRRQWMMQSQRNWRPSDDSL